MQLLQERKDFSFPPYSRIIELTVKDMYEDRAVRMANGLAGELRCYFAEMTGPYAPVVDKVADLYIRRIRISLKKDRNLSVHKHKLNDMISLFVKKHRYDGHITIDVDPS
jgi:primosomal protein N' (replication factor Y)